MRRRSRSSYRIKVALRLADLLLLHRGHLIRSSMELSSQQTKALKARHCMETMPMSSIRSQISLENFLWCFGMVTGNFQKHGRQLRMVVKDIKTSFSESAFQFILSINPDEAALHEER